MKVFKQNDFIKEKKLAEVLYEFDEKLCYDQRFSRTTFRMGRFL